MRLDRCLRVNGFVLIEVLFAVVILSVGLTAVLQAMMTHARLVRSAADRLEAVETLDGTLLSQIIAPAFGKEDHRIDFDAPGPCVEGSTRYQCSLISAGTTSAPYPNVTWTVMQGEVSWPSGKGNKAFSAAFFNPEVKTP